MGAGVAGCIAGGLIRMFAGVAAMMAETNKNPMRAMIGWESLILFSMIEESETDAADAVSENQRF